MGFITFVDSNSITNNDSYFTFYLPKMRKLIKKWFNLVSLEEVYHSVIKYNDNLYEEMGKLGNTEEDIKKRIALSERTVGASGFVSKFINDKI